MLTPSVRRSPLVVLPVLIALSLIFTAPHAQADAPAVVSSGETITLPGHAVALTSADFDGDGVPDLITVADDGSIEFRRGNVDSIFPKGEAALPFFSPTRPALNRAVGQVSAFLPQRPDWLFAGDFDADSQPDLIAATRGDKAMTFLFGDGRGGFPRTQTLDLPDPLTTLAVGHINRLDTLPDVLIGTASSVLIYEGAAGAANADPETIEVDHAVTALAFGQFDDHFALDFAVGAGHELLIVHGRDRKLTLDEAQRAGVPAPQIERYPQASPIAALASGNFVAEERYTEEIAVLHMDGTLGIVNRSGLETAAFDLSWQASVTDETQARLRMIRIKTSSLPTDDLIVIDPLAKQLRLITTSQQDAPKVKVRAELKSQPLGAADPIGVLPMRLNRDALDDVVIAQADGSLSVIPTRPAATYVVSSIADNADMVDCNPGNGVCEPGYWNLDHSVCTPTGAGCTLRAALQDANAHTGADEIVFGYVVNPIQAAAALPAINEPLTIDGSTTSGASHVELVGTNAGAGVNGLDVDTNNSVVRGFVIHGFQNSGIYDGFGVSVLGTGNYVENNRLGTDKTGQVALGNGNGGVIIASGSSLNTIGGTITTTRNIISGNDGHGLQIGEPLGGASSNSVQNNYIGLGADGSTDLGNWEVGVIVAQTSFNNLIGGSNGRNVIGGNGQAGVWVQNGPQGTLIAGNYIGLDATGTLDRGNLLGGVGFVDASYNQLGYTAPADRNLIAANEEFQVGVSFAPTLLAAASPDRPALKGMELYRTGSSDPQGLGDPDGLAPAAVDQAANNNIQNNRIGVKFGTAPLFGDQYPGVTLRNAISTTIGGVEANTGNLIARNQIGVLIYSSGGTSALAVGNVIQGNKIGTDLTGVKSDEDDTPFNGNDWGNVLAGVILENAANTQVGGNIEAARNVIAGSYGYGVWITGTQAVGNVIQRNAIGTTITGTKLAHGVGTGLAGVWIDGGSQSTIGGSDVTSNTLGYSLGRGIVVASGTRHDLRYNRIFANRGVPIDLGDDGVTPNDAGDIDTGANNLQNTPVITQVVGKVITGTYTSFTNTAYSLEFYSYPVCEPMPGGHLADTYLLTKTVTTNVSGTATFSVTLPNAVPNGYFVSATATDPQGNTSEFSNMPIVLRVSSSNFIPTSVFTPGHTLLAYTDVDPYLAAQLATCLNQFQLFVAQNGDLNHATYLNDNGLSWLAWQEADLQSNDLHWSAWYTPTGSTTTTLELYITQHNDLQNAVLLDRVTLKPLPGPELIVLTDFRALFDEFNLTATDSATKDTNGNRTIDYYEAVERVRKYGADHAGAIIDVRQDAYGPADFEYAANANRPQMYPAIDQLVGFVPTSSMKYVAVIGDDAVLPFYRIADPEVHDECKYFATITCTLPIDHGVPAMIDTQANFILSDVPYSTHVVTTTRAPLAEWGLGRIFARAPLSLTAMIDGYEQPVLAGPQTGSAFLFNIKNDAHINWQDKVRPFDDLFKNSGYVSLTVALTDRGTPLHRLWDDEQAGWNWTPGNVAYALDAPLAGPRLTLLSSHANHLYNVTPTTTHFSAAYIDIVKRFPGSVLVDTGCHAGYSTGYDATNLPGNRNYYTNALVRALLERNITYQASTTFGWTTGVAFKRYSERVHYQFLERLIAGPQTTIGEVRREAQRTYYDHHPAADFNDTDFISIYGTELYGLPTQAIRRQPAPVAVMAMVGQDDILTYAATNAITINFTAPNFRVTFDDQNRALFEVPNGGDLTALGAGPIVPVLARSIYLPAGSTNVQVTWIASTTNPYGSAVQLQRQQVGNESFGVSEVPYTLTAPYPETPYWVNTYADARGVRVVVSLVPLRWDPISGQVTLINTADFQIDFAAPPAAGTSINAISINDGNPVAIDQLARSISATITTDTPQPLALRWHIATISDAPLVGEWSTFTPTVGGNGLTWQFDTLGWQPGLKVLHVQIEDAHGIVIASSQQVFTVTGNALQLSTDQSVYDTGDSQATIQAEVRDVNGAAVNGLSGSFAQQLDGNAQALTWQAAGDGYTANLNLAPLSAGTHTLDVSVNDAHNTAGFAIDRAAPASTAESTPVSTSPSFTVTLSGQDDASGIKEYVVQYRVGTGGIWTHWLTQTTAWDYTLGEAPNFELTFGPDQPVGVTGNITYFFRIRAIDYAGYAETTHAAPDTFTVYHALPKVYLPLIQRNATSPSTSPSRYVSRSGTDSGSCGTSATACLTVQYAVDQSSDGEVIAIAGYEAAYTLERPGGSPLLTYHEAQPHAQPDGYYGPDQIQQVVYLDKSVTLRGGYSPAFTTRDLTLYKTVLRPGLNGREGRVIVVPPFASPVIEGLYLLEGDASSQGGEYYSGSYNLDVGGGLFAQGAPLSGDTITIRDCTIAGNMASRTGSDANGGGVYLDARHDAVFSNNRVYNNVATEAYGSTLGQGGGVFIRYSNRVQIANNAIYSNTAATENRAQGGGLNVYGARDLTLQNNTLTGNVGTRSGDVALGGGVYLNNIVGGVVAGNVISGNLANVAGGVGSGGGLSVYQSRNLTISQNQILDNSAAPASVTSETSGGGGVRISTTSTGITLVNNVIARNLAPFGGGGILFVANYSSEVVQATLLHNTLANNGVPITPTATVALARSAAPASEPRRGQAGIEVFSLIDTAAHPDQATAVPREAQAIQVVGYVTLRGYNTIISGHTRGVYEYNGTLSDTALDYTLWYANTTHFDATVGHTNDRFGNPVYVDAAARNYHIGATSAAKDAGGNFGVTVDIDGQARPFGSGYDLGADEYR